MNPTISMLDGVEQNRSHPDTFQIPTDMEKMAVQPGDWIKISFTDGRKNERMWVKVIAEGLGILDNDPVFLPMKCGEQVHFQPHHIISIHYKE